MAAEKLNQIAQVSLRNMHASTLTHVIQQDLWRNLAPASQHLKADPVQLKVLVAHRVMDQPTWAATDTGTALNQLKLLSKLRQYRLRLHQTNKYPRITAKGLRNSQYTNGTRPADTRAVPLAPTMKADLSAMLARIR